MKAVFVHSARFVRTPDGKVHSNSQFPYSIWQRYLKYFDELTVICRMADVKEAPPKWDLSSGPRVKYAGTFDDHGKPFMQLQSSLALPVIRKELEHCDAVIVRQSKLGWLAAQVAIEKKIPWFVEVVCDAWDAHWNYGTLVGKLYAPVAAFNSRRWIKQADFAKYVTKEYLQKRYPCNGSSCGVSDVQINSVPKNVMQQRISRWQTQKPDHTHPVVIGLIGSLFNRYKGLHVALRALRILKDQGHAVQLRVLGDGHLALAYQEAKNLGVGELLHLDGCLPSGEPVMKWLDALDIYIQPSFQEGLPRALIEAMSRGLPALGSTCGGIPELLPAECLHRPGDVKTFTKQLLHMIQDLNWRTQQAQRNYTQAQNYYSEQVEAKSEAFWQQFVEYIRKQKSMKNEKAIF